VTIPQPPTATTVTATNPLRCGTSPPPVACFKVAPTFTCLDGVWQMRLGISNLLAPNFDAATIYSTAPPSVTVVPPVVSFVPPPGIPVTLQGATPGLNVTLNLCAFSIAQMQSGKPYDCCRSTVTFTVPKTCK
jgi:hypothetical protein